MGRSDRPLYWESSDVEFKGVGPGRDVGDGLRVCLADGIRRGVWFAESLLLADGSACALPGVGDTGANGAGGGGAGAGGASVAVCGGPGGNGTGGDGWSTGRSEEIQNY